MSKQWKPIEWDECPICGSTAEAYTAEPDDYFRDGDEVRCDDCHYPGWISCDAESSASVLWVEDGYPAEAADRIEELEAKVKRLTSRGFEDLHHENAQLHSRIEAGLKLADEIEAEDSRMKDVVDEFREVLEQEAQDE